MNLKKIINKKFAALLILAAASGAASAVDGCKVLLCFAAPNGWRNVSDCVADMNKMLRDLSLGKSIPKCSFSSGNGDTTTATSAAASNHVDQEVSSVWNCPAQFLHIPSGAAQGGEPPYCMMNGAISVTINGSVTNKTWWNSSGQIFEEVGPAAGTTSTVDTTTGGEP